MDESALSILRVPTPQAWVEHAVAHWQELLADHANCEKKAASTALALMFAYPEDRALCLALARLAREELRHYEQVQKLMGELAVPVQRLAPGRYAGALRARMASSEPVRKLDLLLCGALIEARSCERFEALVSQLQEPLAGFYAGLSASERRHAGLYLQLARAEVRGDGDETRLQRRLAELADVEAGLISSPDEQFRFHSGVPVIRVRSAGAAVTADAAG